jgi:hypothetical protein
MSEGMHGLSKLQKRVLCSMRSTRPCILLLIDARAESCGLEAMRLSAVADLTKEDGELDRLLTNFAIDNDVTYTRLELSLEVTCLYAFSVRYLPQVRLMHAGKLLLRSGITRGQAGNFIASNVGGKSIQQPMPLLEALATRLVFVRGQHGKDGKEKSRG